MVLAVITAAVLALALDDTPVARAHDDTPPPLPASASGAIAAAAPVPARQGSPTLPAANNSADPTADQIAEWLKADAVPVQPLDPHASPTDITSLPRQVHGEVGAVFSNRGYGAYARTSVPLGEASQLDLGVAGGQFKNPWGRRANPRSISVGLYLDGRDVQRWISRDKCNVPRWGVSLPSDPKVLPDGSCEKADRTTAARSTPTAAPPLP